MLEFRPTRSIRITSRTINNIFFTAIVLSVRTDRKVFGSWMFHFAPLNSTGWGVCRSGPTWETVGRGVGGMAHTPVLRCSLEIFSLTIRRRPLRQKAPIFYGPRLGRGRRVRDRKGESTESEWRKVSSVRRSWHSCMNCASAELPSPWHHTLKVASEI